MVSNARSVNFGTLAKIMKRLTGRRSAASPQAGNPRQRLRHPGVPVVLAVALTCAALVSGSAASASAREADTGVNASALPEGSTAFRIGGNPWSSAYSNNPYSATGTAQYDDLALLGLAYYSADARPGSNPYYPELATHWLLDKSAVTITLRKSARWQDGKPFTSKDVLTSLLLAGANYNSIWGSLTSASAPNAHEVRLNLQPWAVAQNVFVELLQVTILPASVYGSLVPPHFAANLLTYWHEYNVLHPTAETIKAASNTAAGKAIAAAAAKLVRFTPKSFVGDGPYKLVHETTGGVLYEKWNGWWDAKSIRAPWVEVYPMSTATQYGATVAGRIDFQRDEQFTDPQVARLDQTPFGHYVVHPAPVQQESLVFHLSDYPFNLLQVRQALAYIIDRTKLVQLDLSGKLLQNPPEKHPDGINIEEAKLYLSAKQLNSLHSYSHNPAKAASLLKSVGFTKRHGTWYTPKGKPFAFTIDEEAGYGQFDEDGVIMAQMLKKFGIPATTTDINEATYAAEEEAGDYAVSENFMDWGTGSPMADFAATFGGSQWNYPIYYNGKGSCHCKTAIGIGPIADVPGLGEVNIAASLNDAVNSAPPSTWSRYTWDWARFINDELPILPLYNNAYHESDATSRYKDFPPTSRAWLWTEMAGAEQMIVWQQLGYLKLKHP